MSPQLDAISVPPDATLRSALTAIDRGGARIALVVDKRGCLVGTLTDGDIRRAILDGAALEDTVTPYTQRRFTSVAPDTTRNEVLDLMQARSLQQIPVLDGDGRLVGLHLLREILGRDNKPNWAVIMAGGRGERLRPLTDSVLKPMVRVAGRPILERIVLLLVGQGIQRIFLSINYLGDTVESHFGDGSNFGCRIEYLREDTPLGTGGSLSLLPATPQHPVLVLNGDLVTQLDIAAMLNRHATTGAAATVAVKQYSHQVPFGVVRTDGNRVVDLREKPLASWMVNAGVYVLQPQLLGRIPSDVDYPLPALLEHCLESHETVTAFPIEGDWLDVGHPAELRVARGEEP